MDRDSTALKIAGAARKLLERHGAEGVTMRRVANAVGITPMAVYRHYADRADLLNALANEGFAELASQLKVTNQRGSIEQRLLKMADAYLEHALRNPRLFELMFLETRAGARRYPRDFQQGESPTANFLIDAIREGMQSGYLRKENAVEIVFEMGALSHGLIMLFLGGRIAVSAEEFRRLYSRSFRRYLRGIRK
jgi:AcrR family transcriptional regulator